MDRKRMSRGGDDKIVEITLRVERAGDLRADELECLTQQLRTELLQTDVLDVHQSYTSDVPLGAKAGWAVTAGTLVVSLLPTAIPKLIEALRNWSTKPYPTFKMKTPSGLDFEFSGNMSVSEATKLADRLLKASSSSRGVS